MRVDVDIASAADIAATEIASTTADAATADLINIDTVVAWSLCCDVDQIISVNARDDPAYIPFLELG